MENNTETSSNIEKQNSNLPSNEEIPPVEQSPEETGRNKLKDLLVLFLPREGYFVTPIILSINVLVFLLMVISGTSIISPDNESILSWGGNLRSLVLGGEVWRLLTCCFLHIGILHLLMNMYALVAIGAFLEHILGRSRFLLLYLVSGIFSSTASIWWNELTISAGASGAIFGLFGGSFALFTTNLFPKEIRSGLLKNSLFILVINLVYGLSMKGIDNSAHIGGLAAGIIIGISFYPGLKRKISLYNKVVPAAACLVLLVLAVVLFKNIKDYSKEYDELLNEYLSFDPEGLIPYYSGKDTLGTDRILQTLALQESLAYELYTNANYFEKEKLLDYLYTRYPYYWRQNQALLGSVPVKNSILKKYGSSVYNSLMSYYFTREKSYGAIYQYVNDKAVSLKSSKDLLVYFIDIEKEIWKENVKIYHELLRKNELPVSIMRRIELKEKLSSLLIANSDLILNEISGHDNMTMHKLIENKDKMTGIFDELQKTRSFFLR